ncbi:MAG TPA: glycosyltransferase family 4 protein, partial [Stellaceae bacterium]|nr:glycosyltransferase family 4 protein [Stellaceae bacterium]
LPGIWRHGPITAHRPVSWGFAQRLRPERFDALWVHGYARSTNWAAMLSAKRRGLKILVRDEATLFSAERSRMRRAAKNAFFASLRALADGFLAIGTANREYYIANGVPAARIFSMPYCVDNDFFARRAGEAAGNRDHLRGELGLEVGRPIILYASKFEPRKRPLDLLLAYERLVARCGTVLPYLLFAGDGKLRASLEASARSKALDGVKFLGFQNQTELPALYDLCDAFVLPSVREPWGLVVNEVMAAGRAVIVSDQVGCARDLVRQGINGMIYPAGNVEALADALAAVTGDPARSTAMGLEGRKIISRWSFEEDVAGLRHALRTVVS